MTLNGWLKGKLKLADVCQKSDCRAVLMCCFLLCFISGRVYSETEIIVKGLYKNGAIAEINGKQRVLKVGVRSPEGVLLLSANSKKALAEVDGEKVELTLDRTIGGAKYRVPERREVRIQSGERGHYFTPGRINNRAVNFMVDTGASAIAMNTQHAENLGLQFRRGKVTSVSTANGTARAYRVTLASVSIGDVLVNNVDALVLDGASPSEILLGNSYLSRIEMQVENGVLVLQTKF